MVMMLFFVRLMRFADKCLVASTIHKSTHADNSPHVWYLLPLPRLIFTRFNFPAFTRMVNVLLALPGRPDFLQAASISEVVEAFFDFTSDRTKSRAVSPERPLRRGASGFVPTSSSNRFM